MDTSEENFFETLAGVKAAADESYGVELAKAETASVTAARVKAAAQKMTDADEAEDEWNDGEPEGKLMVDVYQTPSEIVIESAIAGTKPENIDVNATADSVTIRGSRKREKEVKDENYLYQECYWGKFARSVILPQEVDPEGAAVTFKHGVLVIRLPKVNRKKTKKLSVKTE